MQIFPIGPIMEAIQQAIMEEREPDPALVALLIQEGPKAIEEWTDAIANVEAESDALKKRIDELKARKDARDKAVERMEGALLDVLKRHFEGKVKTAFVTTWVQKTPTYQISTTFEAHPELYRLPEPELKKKDAIAAYKEGLLPKDVEVVEDVTESLRVRRL